MLFNHVLVANDFSDCSECALDLGVRMAEALGAKLTLVHAWDVPAYVYANTTYVPADVVSPIADAARAHLDDAVGSARRTVPRAQGLLRQGLAWREILGACEDCGADVIVLGTHGRTGLTHVFLGSVAEHVVRAATVPVLTVHASNVLPHRLQPDQTSTPPAPPMF